MADTNRMGLPLLAPAQAQKHVTVNEAMVRLDGLTNLVLASVSTALPPVTVVDGVCYGVPAGALEDWTGHEGEIAIGTNGGWVYATPERGWRAYVSDLGVGALHDGSGWVTGALTVSAHGAGLRAGLAEVDHAVSAGTVSLTGAIIPSHAMVIGVSARVTAQITGTLTSWRLGHAGSEDRFGAGLGLALGSWTRGMLGAPLTYWAPTTLQLSATGGSFASGTVRLAVHYLEISLPAV